MCSCDLGTFPDFVTRTRRRAAKRHTCEECRGLIEPGTGYEYVCGKWEGEMMVFRTCLYCVAARDLMECFTYGGLEEDLRNCADEYPLHNSGGKRFAIGRALVGMRRRIGKPVANQQAAA